MMSALTTTGYTIWGSMTGSEGPIFFIMVLTVFGMTVWSLYGMTCLYNAKIKPFLIKKKLIKPIPSIDNVSAVTVPKLFKILVDHGDRIPEHKNYTEQPKIIHLDDPFSKIIWLKIELESDILFNTINIRFVREPKTSDPYQNRNFSKSEILINKIEGNDLESIGLSSLKSKQDGAGGCHGYFEPPLKVPQAKNLYLKVFLEKKPQTNGELITYLSIRYLDNKHVSYEIIFKNGCFEKR
jgi:hypothetical protein